MPDPIKVSELTEVVSMGTEDFFPVNVDIGSGVQKTRKIKKKNTGLAYSSDLTTAQSTATSALNTASSGSVLASQAYRMASTGTNGAASAMAVAQQAYTLAVTGTSPTLLTQQAYALAVTGTAVASAAYATSLYASSIAVSGTDLANAAQHTADEALTIATAGTNGLERTDIYKTNADALAPGWYRVKSDSLISYGQIRIGYDRDGEVQHTHIWYSAVSNSGVGEASIFQIEHTTNDVPGISAVRVCANDNLLYLELKVETLDNDNPLEIFVTSWGPSVLTSFDLVADVPVAPVTLFQELVFSDGVVASGKMFSNGIVLGAPTGVFKTSVLTGSVNNLANAIAPTVSGGYADTGKTFTLDVYPFTSVPGGGRFFGDPSRYTLNVPAVSVGTSYNLTWSWDNVSGAEGYHMEVSILSVGNPTPFQGGRDVFGHHSVTDSGPASYNLAPGGFQSYCYIDNKDSTVLVDAGTRAVTAYLPSDAAVGSRYNVKKLGTGNLTVSGSGTSIDGQGTYQLQSNYDWLTVECTGSAYSVLSRYNGIVASQPSAAMAVAQQAYTLATSGTLLALSGSNLASYALGVAVAGTNRANAAYTVATNGTAVATSGSNLASSAYALAVRGTNAVATHTHVASDITDFAPAVQAVPGGLTSFSIDMGLVSLVFGIGIAGTVIFVNETIEFTVDTYVPGSQLNLLLTAGVTGGSLIFPAGWVWFGAIVLDSMAPHAVFLLRIQCFGSTESSVVVECLPTA